MVLMPIFEDTIGPMVVPQGASFRTTKSCTGTSACLQTSRKSAEVRAVVAYRWLAFILMTMPLWNSGLCSD